MNIDQIINGCKQGDRRSQDLLVRQYAPLLMGVCQRYCNDREMAKDSLQETFINIFKYINGYNGTGSFEGWMRRIAVNCSYQFVNKMRRIHFFEDIDLHNKIATEIPDIYSQLGKEELLDLIRRLPEGQYLVFNMKIIEGYSHKEIAEILNITASTSRSNLTRARAKLCKYLLKEDNSSAMNNSIAYKI